MRNAILLGAAAALVGVAACTDNRAIVTAPIGAPVYSISQTIAGTNIPRGTATFVLNTPASANDSVQLSIGGLDTLENGFYTVWLGDSATGTFKRATGSLSVVRTDTIFNRFGDAADSVSSKPLSASVSAFSNGGPRNRYIFSTSRAQSGLALTDGMQTVLVTIESTNSAASPSASRRPLWARRDQLTKSGTSATTKYSGPLKFGHFELVPGSSYVYVATGRGRVAFRGMELVLLDSSLTRPPLGYYYAAFGVRRDTSDKVTDTIYLGELSSPYPRRSTSLRDADTLIVDAAVQTVTPPAILAAEVFVRGDTIARLKTATGTSFAGLAQVLLTLESKNKTTGRLGPATILTVDVPSVIRTPPTR